MKSIAEIVSKFTEELYRSYGFQNAHYKLAVPRKMLLQIVGNLEIEHYRYQMQVSADQEIIGVTVNTPGGYFHIVQDVLERPAKYTVDGGQP